MPLSPTPSCTLGDTLTPASVAASASTPNRAGVRMSVPPWANSRFIAATRSRWPAACEPNMMTGAPAGNCETGAIGRPNIDR